MAWILLTLFYGVVKGAREIVKKKALEISTVMEVLFFYTLLGFLMLIPDIPHVWGMSVRMYLLVAIKSFVIFVAWLCGFYAVKRLPVSVYGILDLSRVLFSTLLGVIVIGERLKPLQIAGLCLVAEGLMMLGMRRRREKSEKRSNMPFLVILAFLSAFLNAVSGTMDKILTIREGITTSQLQFWYMLYLLVFYGLFILITRRPVNAKKTIKNYWIWILSILFILADRALFMANAYPESRVTVMTILKQAGTVVTILAGRIVFKEKDTVFKLFCAAVIIAGIVLGAV